MTFRARADAERFRLELLAAWRERDGVPLTAHEVAEARAAWRLLAENEIVGVSLVDAVRAALPVLRKNGQMPVAELMEAFRSVKAASWRPKSEKNFRDAARRFCEAFGERPVAGLQPAELSEWLAGTYENAVTRAHVRRTLEPAFNYAVRQEVIEVSPWSKVERERLKKDSPIDILTVPEAMRLMNEAPADCKAAFALMLFAGIRPQEVERLKWDDIREGVVHVTALAAKTRQVRNVEVLPVLAAWLDAFRGEGSICPPNWKRKRQATRRAVGLESRQDVLRHSFASYHLAAFGDINATKLQLGHSARSDLLFAHYRAAVTKTAAAGFWKLFPPGYVKPETKSSRRCSAG